MYKQKISVISYDDQLNMSQVEFENVPQSICFSMNTMSILYHLCYIFCHFFFVTGCVRDVSSESVHFCRFVEKRLLMCNQINSRVVNKKGDIPWWLIYVAVKHFDNG